MRKFAGDLWKFYSNNAWAQDLAETGIGAGLAAGYQGLFTDMSPEEIALSTGLGAAGALAMRPLLARAGYAGGRALDKAFPDLGDQVSRNPFMAQMSVGSPQSLKVFDQLPDNEMNRAMKALTQAKYNQNFLTAEGTERGFAEGMTGLVGRQYGDNIAQLLIALGTPMFIGDSEANVIPE